MDLGYLPPLPVGLMSAAARDLAGRVGPVAAAAERRLPSRPAAVVLASVCAAWLINAMDWGYSDVRFLVAMSLGSLVATSALAFGWSSEPEELERWSARALLAAVASALPALSWA
jgi:hypothetical protein